MRMNHVIFVALLSVVAVENLVADQWHIPRERGRLVSSQNSRFAAYVTPSKDKAKPLLEVFEIKDSQEVLLWHCRLGNLVSPLEVYIADDGQHVVTVNDPPQVGYGDYVLAFYGPKGLIKNYSLEKILHSLKVDPTDFDDIVPKSITSRWWDRYSIKFLDTHEGATHLCMWFHLLDRWVAWDLANGRRVEITQAMVRKWNNRARRWAIKTIEERSFSYQRGPYGEETPYVFLSTLKNPQDRNIIEQLLSHEEFNTTAGSYRGEFLHCTQASSMRSLAENLLAEWDGRPTERPAPNDEGQQIYYHLGIVYGTIKLPHVPRVGDGTIWAYLVPAAAPVTDQWHEKPPIHRLVASFDEFLISTYEAQKSKVFLFGIEGVTPGEYRIKAVWDRVKPHCDEYAQMCLPRTGDYQNIYSPVITVKAGRIVENVVVHCTHKIVEP